MKSIVCVCVCQCVYGKVTPQHEGWYRIYTTKDQGLEDSGNPVPTKHGVTQLTCTTALGYRKHIKTIFAWTVHLFTS